MEDQLRNVLKDKIEHLKVQEIAPAFNARHTWNELEPRLARKERRLVPVWWAYAAALFLGIIIGGSAIYLNVNKGNIELAKTESDLKISKPVIVQKSKPETPVIVSERPAVSPDQKPEVRPEHDDVAVSSTKVPMQGVAAEEMPPMPKPQNQEPVVTTTSKSRAVHLLDIISEARSALINEQANEQHGSSFSLLIRPHGIEREGENSAPPSVLQFNAR